MWCKAINRLARIAFKVHVRSKFYGCFKIYANNAEGEHLCECTNMLS